MTNNEEQELIPEEAYNIMEKLLNGEETIPTPCNPLHIEHVYELDFSFKERLYLIYRLLLGKDLRFWTGITITKDDIVTEGVLFSE